jgi:hypothetical protein
MREVHLKYVQLGSVVEREGRVRRLGARFGVSGIWYLRREHDPHSAWWGVYERVTTQVVAMNGSTYLHSCSGALVAVRLSPDAADSRSASLAKIVI